MKQKLAKLNPHVERLILFTLIAILIVIGQCVIDVVKNNIPWSGELLWKHLSWQLIRLVVVYGAAELHAWLELPTKPDPKEETQSEETNDEDNR